MTKSEHLTYQCGHSVKFKILARWCKDVQTLAAECGDSQITRTYALMKKYNVLKLPYKG